MKQFTLSRNERLKSRKQIELLFREGIHINVFPLRLSYITNKCDDEEPLQIGVGVSARWFKKAVDRNRIKRLLREAWRLQKSDLKQLLLEKRRCLKVFIIYTGKEIPAYDVVSEAVSRLIEKLSSIANENIETGT